MSESPSSLFEKVAGARREWMACFDAITDWVFVKAPDLTIIKANRAAAALFSRTPQNLIGNTCQSLFGSESLPPDDALVLETFRTGQQQNADIADMPVPGEFQVTTYPLMDDTGNVVAVVEYVRDVSEQRAMQRQVLQSARLAAIGELAAGVAHNFGNILMGVGGSLEVMLLTAEKEQFSPRVVERMRMMHRELMRGDNIVKRLLSFARGSSPTIRPVTAQEVIEGVVGLCQAHPSARGVDLEWSVAEETPAIKADPAQLREVITNLVLNALQATPGGGRVEVSARARAGGEGDAVSAPSDGMSHSMTLGLPLPEGQCVELTVTDTGCGVSEGDMQRLFTPFFSRRRDGSQGTGLGLCVSLGMIEGMGGRVRVESAMGKGTTFTLVLPAYV